MELKILKLDGVKFDGKVSSVSLPSKDGEITILPNHIPLITILKKGNIKIEGQEIAVEGGVAEIDGEKVVVLAN